MEKWTCQYLIFTEILWGSQCCQYLSIFMGEETDLEFVKSFTPARFQILNLWGRIGKVDLVDLSILSHILKYCHILPNIVTH